MAIGFNTPNVRSNFYSCAVAALNQMAPQIEFWPLARASYGITTEVAVGIVVDVVEVDVVEVDVVEVDVVVANVPKESPAPPVPSGP
jgi:hypothetical protein